MTHEYDITRRIRLDAHSFDSTYNPHAFSDRLADMNYFFEWYMMSDEHNDRFTKMELTRLAKIY